MIIPADRHKHGKKLASMMSKMMYEKYIRGYLKYKTKIEEKPLVTEILQELLDLANYYLVLMTQLEDLKKATNTESLEKIRKRLDKLLTHRN